MRILKAEFAGAARAPEQYPRREWPEVVLVGRSNAGKSSVINRLVNRKRLARSGSTPGVTGNIQFYAINDAFHLVDLPGYGYARVSREERATWKGFIEQYLENRPNLRGALLIVDARRAPDDQDAQMMAYFRALGLPFVVVANKADKLGNAEREASRKALVEGLGLPPEAVLLFSAESGMNTNRLWSAIRGYVE
jgi:GTP-binding protein